MPDGGNVNGTRRTETCHVPRDSRPEATLKISSEILRHGGPRANSGGPRVNSGGSRPGAGRPRVRPELKFPFALIPPADGLRWHVLVTEHGQDDAVADIVRDLGFAGFCLRRLIPERNARPREGAPPLPPMSARIVPVLPRYQFVAFDVTDPSWRVIAGQPGVTRFLGTGPERPTPIPDAMVHRLMVQADDRGVILPPAVPARLPPLAVGATARLTSGPFAELEGICRWSTHNRVELFLTAYGRVVDAARDAVEVV